MNYQSAPHLTHSWEAPPLGTAISSLMSLQCCQKKTGTNTLALQNCKL